MIDLLRSGKVVLPPLSFRILKNTPETTKNIGFDLLVEASWRENTARFAVECKALSTPKAFKTGLNLLKTETLPKGYWPLLFLPFLSEQQLQALEQEQDQRHRPLWKRGGGDAGQVCHIPQRREEPFFLISSDQEHLSKKQFHGVQVVEGT